MKTVLYATDRTEQSVPMLHYAHDMSVRLGADLVILYVYQYPQIRVAVTRRPEQIELKIVEEQKEILKAFCKEHLGSEINGKKVRFEAACDDSVLNAILEKSGQISPDLILIGRKEKHTDRGIFAGDIGQGLVKKSSCPVLIAPNDVNGTSVDTIVYATDFEEADILAIKRLVPIAKTVDAKIHIIHVVSKDKYAGKEKMEWFEDMLAEQVDYGNMEFNLVFSDNIVKEIDSYSMSVKADLLVLLHREEKDFFQNLFNRSVVAKLEDHIGIPLLSFNKAG